MLEGAPVEVLDDQGVGLRQRLTTRSVTVPSRVLDGGHAHRADDDEVEVVLVDVVDDDLEVLAFEGAADQFDVVLLTRGFQDVDVRVGDDLQPFGNELVVDLALPLHRPRRGTPREPALHLPEAHVVHLGRVGVATRDPAPELPRDVDPDHARLVGVVRVVYRDVDLFVYNAPLASRPPKIHANWRRKRCPAPT